jgi:hypothetical protein
MTSEYQLWEAQHNLEERASEQTAELAKANGMVQIQAVGPKRLS